MDAKVRRNYYIEEVVDKALAHAAIEKGMDKSGLVSEALRHYLPKISQMPQVAAIAKEVAA